MRVKIGLFGVVALFIAVAVVSGCSRNTSRTSGAGPGASGSGEIQIKGSDTMVNLGQVWAEEYMKKNPNVSIAVTGGGSGTGIAAMIDGRTDIAQASRAMKDKEITMAKDRGVDPVEHVVATDALSVIVNPANPVSKLTISQLSDIFTGKTTNWKQVGGRDASIILLSRDRSSGSHIFFLEHVLRKGKEKGTEEFAKFALMLPSTEAIASQVSTDKNAIGYVGIGYVKPKQHKVLAIGKTDAGPFVKPSIETAINGTYPIARPLYWYTRGEPKGAVKGFLDYVVSPEGQKEAEKVGFAPIGKTR